MGGGAGMHRNGAAIAGDTASGTVAGAAIGTGIAPGIGTAIGAGVGAVGGFLTGLLTGYSPDDPAPPDAPPPPADLGEEIAQRAELAKQARMMAEGAGNYVSGPLGDTSKAPGSAPRAGGI